MNRNDPALSDLTVGKIISRPLTDGEKKERADALMDELEKTR